jgi:hypothetical protein
VPFWIWSFPLHADVEVVTKEQASGCNLTLWIDFVNRIMFVVVIPDPVGLGIRSNGQLEHEYLDAIEVELRNSQARR